jgi:FkbM family methyltransferase
MKNQMIASELHRAGPALLRRVGLSKFLNYNHPFVISKRKFSIPILGGLGEGLLKLKPDFKSEIIRMFADLPACFVDVGANIGQTIIESFSAKNWGAYYAFEPDTLCSAYLRALIEANRLPVTVLPFAAGSNASPHSYYANGPADAAATMSPESRPDKYTSEMATWIATYPLDLLLDIAKIPFGTMIKIDVEGFEGEVLTGSNRILNEVRPILLCEVLRAYNEREVSFVNERMVKLEAILALHGFRVFYIEMENDGSGQIRALKEISAFPRGLWRDNPSGADYVFIPAEKPLPKGCFIDCAK